MKHTKRILSVLLALVLLALSVPFAAAEDSYTIANDLNYTITVDEPLTVQIKSGKTTIIEFTPTETDIYYYRSDAAGDSYGLVYDADMNLLESDDDGGESNNFGIFLAFEAGKKYYLGARFLNTTFSGTFSVKISVAGNSCSDDSINGLTASWNFDTRTLNFQGEGVTQSTKYIRALRYYVKSVVIGDEVTSIGDSTFYGFTALESVTIGDSVETIGNSAFYNCTALESVTLPDGITSIGGSAFSGNNSWYTLALCNKDTTTAATLAATDFPYAFLDGTDEDNLIIEKVNESLSFTIDKRTRTMTVQTNGVMVSFASFAAPWLEYQKYITDVVILPGCTSVSARAFQRCFNLKRVTLPDGIESIGNSAFYECRRLIQINLPDSVETIGSEAFQYCTALASVTIGDSVESIGSSAFYNCTALESVTIGDSVTSIGDYAFSYCTALKSIDLGNGVTSIGREAFRYSGLESIVIPDSVKTLNGIEYSDYYYNNNYGYTFADCRSLKTVVIGDGLTAIPYSAFSGCSALETVSIGENVTAIYAYAFSGCTALETVSFGENVQTINYDAFSGCTSLHTVVLPESVKTLRSRSFPEKALKDLYIYNAGQCSIAEDAVFYSATIHAYPDSPAANFFENRGYNFEPLTDAPAHEHDSTLVKGTAPTCTDAGLTDGYKCSVCGKWITKQKTIKALGHDYQLAETVPPTETENGFNRYECSRCDAAYTEVIPVSSHAHNYTVTDSRPATCLEGGFTTYVCYGCGHSYTDILEPLNHAFGAWKTFFPAEAGAKGVDVRFCSVCGAYELRESESIGTGTGPVDPTHTHNYVTIETKNATCENAGYVRSICACGDGKVEILDALGHEDKDNDGKCDRCGVQTGEPADPCKNGHDLGDWIVRSEPTCTQPGFRSKYCKRCYQPIVTEEIAKLGHIDENKDGKCDRCGVQTGEPADPCANGHDLGDWVTRSEPTCTKPGYKSKYCKNCNQPIETEEIAALGHDFKQSGEISATCTDRGTRTERCTRCGTEQYEIIEALGHTDGNKDGKCDRCKEKITDGEEDLNFFQRIIRWFENLFAKLFGKEN